MLRPSHGSQDFDKNYYKRFFVRYNEQELDMYYRWHWGWANFLDRFIDLKEGAGRRVLELGSSIGSFAKVAGERGFDIVASDVSSFIVAKGKKLLKNIDFVRVDAEKGINLKGNFDFIFAFEVIEHVGRPEMVLKNVKGKLKKGGTFVFSTPYPTTRSLSDPTHINVHKPFYWKKLGKEVGFKKMRFTHASFIPYFYRHSKFLSFGFPIKTDLPYINSTVIFFFEK